MWAQIGSASARTDVAAHGAALLELAPLLYRDLHSSLNRTVNTTASPGHLCYPHRADGVGTYTGCNFRAYSEMSAAGPRHLASQSAATPPDELLLVCLLSPGGPDGSK